MTDLEKLSAIIEKKRNEFIQLSDKIWEIAETRFEEFRSAELLCQALEKEGFSVQKGVGGMETAFIGSCGSGTPVVAILGEFDALPGLSQKKGVASANPLVEGGNGHGCGHNLLGTGSLAAAVALKTYMEEAGIAGTVRYYGCPAEEGGSGKTFMAREGLFDDVDFALCWHPAPANGVFSANSLANYQVYFKFAGRSSHAAASPHLGRSALDAVELMNVGVNYLREHIIPDARVHYAITNAGGAAPNVVQAEAEVLYLIRAPKTPQVEEIYQRVCNIARGAALMTGTKVEIVFDKACSNLVPNTVLEQVMHEVFTKLGVPVFDDEERKFAREMRATFSAEDINSIPSKALRDKELADFIMPYGEQRGASAGSGSTDVGDVSWIAPTVQCVTACMAVGTPFHTWQLVAQGATSIAHKGMLHAGKVMAATALEAMRNPAVLAEAKAELSRQLAETAYTCPIPKDVKPSPKK
ncbi:amidohydrolase [Gordoniibacillus kamchatkensis]|uniref:Amidohydrolase n=1 Tax=Gordoniibacillus kamchatkensis TaxID=1590651 RepID=A0ABR5AJL5_9BACL|nr:M20 family metallopeptidase [Paenibacillus sp. VKM B-2647]KIL41231.1 amidohydrolase [Paenibacillus sp. VKM B-2647]